MIFLNDNTTKKITKYFIYVVIIGITYTFGALSFKNNIEPIPTLRKLKSSPSDKIKIDNTQFYNSIIKDEISKIKLYFENFNPSKIRNEIINDFILPDSIVDLSIENGKYDDCYIEPIIYQTKFYGIKQRGIFESNNKKKLLIYLQGHRGFPCNFNYYKEIKEQLNEDFDFLTFSMFGLGFNKMDSIAFPIKINKKGNQYTYHNNSYSEFGNGHDVIQFYYDENYPNKKPLSLFISSPHFIINEIIKSNKYDEIYLTGISGGGWYATILSGLIPEINSLYSFNGTLPLIYRINTNSKGDYEQQFSELWNKYDYYTFYFLSLFDNKNNLKRNSFHIYSEFDECCFSSPEVNYFEKSIRELGIPNLKTKIFKGKTEHNIEVKWLVNNIKEVN